MDRSQMTRREFARLVGAGAIAASPVATASVLATTRGRTISEHGRPLQEFGYGQVQLAPGPHREQAEHTNRVLAGLNVDSLMRPYRLLSNLPAPGTDLDGWYKSDGYIPGGTFGIWLSAISRFAAVSADDSIRQAVRKWVDSFAVSIEPSGRYFAGMSWRTWTFEKLVNGLVDAYRFGGYDKALDVLKKVNEIALPHMPEAVVDPQVDGRGRAYTWPENQFIAWQCTGDETYLNTAKRYLYDDFFQKLAGGQNDLPGRHAYSHMLSLSSAAKAYLVLGDQMYLKAAINGFNFVEQQSYTTGLWGPKEMFLPWPIDKVRREAQDNSISSMDTVGDSVEHLTEHTEVPCCAFGHIKLARYLLRITKDPRYGDSIERVVYNTVLGAKPVTPLGKSYYYANYQGRATKQYYNGHSWRIGDAWPCCSGTLAQVASDYGITSYLHDSDGIYVNLYIPSSVHWEQRGAQLTLTQSGDYPIGQRVRFEIQASSPTKFAVHLRIPSWARQPTISVNGKSTVNADAGTFATLRREWQTGDIIEVVLPKSPELRAVDAKHPDMVALVAGPLVLFAVSECAVPPLTRAELLSAQRHDDASSEWFADTQRGRLRFKPWWQINDEAYTTYLRLVDPAPPQTM